MRSKFTAAFHPTDQWERLNVTVQVTGVGFFDFKHGQSGVAPNAIELHPVLATQFGGTQKPPPPSTPQPTARPNGGSFSVQASVSPDPVRYGQEATLYGKSVSGASCSASVVYSTGRPPRSFDGSAKTVGSSGVVSWSWHMESRGSGGTARVTCSYRRQSKSTTPTFSIG